jgi:hypothetical protein
MHLFNTSIRGWLVAAVVLALLSVAFVTTHTSSAKPRPVPGAKSGALALTAPAGPQGPIKLICAPTGHGVIRSDAPAGPQGPVGVKCSPGPTG